MKVKKDSILTSLIFLMIISSPYIQQTVNNLIKLFLELMVLTMILAVNRKVNKKVIFAILPCVFFFFSTTYSTFRWSGISSRLMNSIVTNFGYLLFFYVLFYQCKKNENTVKNVVYENVIFYTIILDIFVLITKGKGLGGLSEPVYLLGNKFMLSYFHMALLSLMINKYSEVKKENKIKIIFYTIYSVLMCRIADTMTGVMGLMFILLYWLFLNKKRGFYKLSIKPVVVLSLFVGLNAIFLLSNVLIQNKMISTFLMKYSHTDTLLSGRLPMYKIVINSISVNKVWGYGINYDIVQQMLSFGNPQNGLLKILLDYGAVGLILFCGIIWKTFDLLSKSDLANKDFGLVAFIYSMFFCSLIEINLDSLFFFFIALIFGCANSYLEKKKYNSLVVY